MSERTFSDKPAKRERWKAIKGFEGLYEVSDLGRVRSLDRIVPHSHGSGSRRLSGKILNPGLFSGRYLSVSLRRRSHSVHRLVAEAFLGKAPKDKPHINHKDNNGANNRVENLEWTDRSWNLIHAAINGFRGKLSPSDIPEIRRLCAGGMLQREIAKKYGVDQTNISCINTGKTWGYL